jgi:glyoxylase I family protein
MEQALAFYRGMLGFDVVFDVELAGEALENVTGEAGAGGRMVGGLLGGTSVELLEITSNADSLVARVRPMLGYTNISLSVNDLDTAYKSATSAGGALGSIVSIGGVRMFFISDPDGTPIEIIEYPNGATTSAAMWRPDTQT